MKLLAAIDSTTIIGGKIENPMGKKYGSVFASGGGFLLFFTNILRLIFVIAGMWALINLIIAGFQYMTAGGDSKALTAAWNRIWQTLLGLIIIVGSFALAALIGAIVFGQWDYIIRPTFYGFK